MTGETVTWHHRTDTGKRDRYNKPILADADTPLDDVLIAPNLGDEVTGTAENTSSTRITLYLSAVAGISADDEITVRGTRYKVLADEADWSTGMSDWKPGSVVQVERKAYVGA
ncbi:hypothetical protein BIU97_10375 [Curtobacterium sp. MCBA15_009]|uniref:hypothetical protein n=1 Tax=Curtobacterium sp. MCBA15_009 TaxID=1898737 RepID=UPI0008DDD641|nr:hypothetical protein [Curtobacterium sp. MCBA15_009]OII10524.1 hypothetical protein BIU97_10375 [Curtobacterium sp. MCBA15_009]